MKYPQPTEEGWYWAEYDFGRWHPYEVVRVGSGMLMGYDALDDDLFHLDAASWGPEIEPPSEVE